MTDTENVHIGGAGGFVKKRPKGWIIGALGLAISAYQKN